MSRRYLRQIVPGETMRDPTMTYVPDLNAIDVDHWLHLPGLWAYVVALHDVRPGVRIANTEEYDDGYTLPARDDAVIHDLRGESIETTRHGGIVVTEWRVDEYGVRQPAAWRMPTAEEARQMLRVNDRPA